MDLVYDGWNVLNVGNNKALADVQEEKGDRVQESYRR